MLRHLLAGTAAALLLALGAVAALAEPPPTTTVDTTTTTEATTTAATTTAPPTTTTAETTTTVSTPTTTAPGTTTSTRTASPTYTLPAAQSCPLGGVIVLPPGGGGSAVGALTDGHAHAAQIDNLTYPADGSIVTASSVTLREGGCKTGRPTGGEARLHDISLFDGAITAKTITLELGSKTSASINGLAVDGKAVAPAARARIQVQAWGYAVTGSERPLPTATGGQAIAALAVHLLQPHAGLPAGTLILVAATSTQPAPATAAKSRTHRATARRHKKRAHATDAPLKVTPPLGQRHYVFPVVGPSDYIDTYGAFRSDVPGNWHHGDDIFAPLGAPVVAVASGTINRVGWEKLGGWRLWVRDSVGDEFYYAHLSGYAPADLHTNRVKAGEVIGFIGNTGDAFTTSPHLHFEIHPRPLLHLGYNGAVDPTKYLDSWTHLAHVDAPRPTHPRLPRQPLLRKEARYVFRELLAVRHFIRHAPKPAERPHVPIPAGANGRPVAAPAPPPVRPPAAVHRSGMSLLTFALLVGLGTLALFGATIAWTPARSRLKNRQAAAAEPDETPSPGETS
jgi:murein DD-endopeptidase MepM/ murein hydrolase activator NlpD